MVNLIKMGFLYDSSIGVFWGVVCEKQRPPASRRSKQKLMEDASRDRDVHRKGHGHHQKSRPKAAHPRSVEEEEAEELGIAVSTSISK